MPRIQVVHKTIILIKTNYSSCRFANVEVVVAAVEILSRYKIVVTDKEDTVQPVYGFITKPEKEVWICIEQVD